MKSLSTLLFASLLFSAQTLAEEITTPEKPNEVVASAPQVENAQEKSGYHFSVGAGYALKSNIRKDNLYKGAHKKMVGKAIPMAQVFLGPVQIGAGGLTLNILGNPFLGAYFNVSQMGDNYYGAGMENRKESWGAGFGVKLFGLQLQLNKDINGRSKGHKGQISYGKAHFFHDDLLVRFGVSLEILDQNYMNYYYGVRAHEATATRPYYAPSAATNVSINAFPVYKYTDDVNFLAGYSLKFLNKKIQDSPTTNDKKLEHAIIFGATYRLK